MDNPPVVSFCFETLPEDVQQALRSLGLEQESFTSVELLDTLKEKYPHLVLLFYTLIYQQLIIENADHLLVRVASIFDFSALDAAAASYYKDNGLGRRRDFSGPILVRVLLLRWLMRWSYRTTADHLRYNWLARWFAGFPLEGKTPSHTTISDFEKWFMENHADLFFSEVLRQLVEAF